MRKPHLNLDFNISKFTIFMFYSASQNKNNPQRFPSGFLLK